MITRRHFIGLAGGAGLAGVGLWAGLVREDLGGSPAALGTGGDAPIDGRVLVVVELDGGNDGVNTLVPVGDGHYRDLRRVLAVPETEVVALTGQDAYALHPSLAPLLPFWEQGALAALAGIGFEGQSRSHFEARDLWWSSTPGVAPTTGWLGRWLDATGDGARPLRAISLGGPSRALVGERLNATLVGDPAEFALRAPAGASSDEIVAAFLATAEPLATDAALAEAQRSTAASVAAVEQIGRAVASEDAADDTTGYQTNIRSLLDTAAGVIGLDIGTQVVVVSVNGFDTHSQQADTHADLLADLAKGISGFFDAIDAQGRRDDVLVVTTSEFGRRVRENASDGTDHGNASALFAIGSAVNGQIVGTMDLGALAEGDLPIVIETQSLYASALDWLGGADADAIVGGTFDRYGLIRV
jgi:uncharacterized protein (DUF1501 family)